MTDIAADERIRGDHQALAEAAAVVGCGPDPEPGDARGQPLQRLAGRGHGAGAARLRCPGRRHGSRRPPADPDRRVLRALRGHHAGRRRARHRDRAAAAGDAARDGPRPADPPARSRSRRGHPGLRGRAGRGHPDRLRQPRSAAAPRRRRVRAAGRSLGERRRQAGTPGGAVRRRQPVADVDAARDPSIDSRCSTSLGCALCTTAIERLPRRPDVWRQRISCWSTAASGPWRSRRTTPCSRSCATTWGSPGPRNAAWSGSAAPAPSCSTAGAWTRASCSRSRPTAPR